MPTWPSEPWFAATRDVAEAAPVPAGLTARVLVLVTGGPDGEAATHRSYEDGRLAARGPGPLEDPDVTLTLGWDDAQALARAELEPDVAFMQGRLKVVGDMGVVLDLLAAAATPQGRASRERLAELSAG